MTWQTIEEKLSKYKYHILQLKSFIKMWDTLNMEDISVNDIRSYIAEKSVEDQGMGNPALCPECGSPLIFFMVNNHPANQVGEGANYQIKCSHCDFEAFTKTTEEFRALVKEDKPS